MASVTVRWVIVPLPVWVKVRLGHVRLKVQTLAVGAQASTALFSAVTLTSWKDVSDVH
ncbi:hypothetical protein D3C85_1177920 [compost metagenome]